MDPAGRGDLNSSGRNFEMGPGALEGGVVREAR